jgi:hypothetical protein
MVVVTNCTMATSSAFCGGSFDKSIEVRGPRGSGVGGTTSLTSSLWRRFSRRRFSKRWRRLVSPLLALDSSADESSVVLFWNGTCLALELRFGSRSRRLAMPSRALCDRGAEGRRRSKRPTR